MKSFVFTVCVVSFLAACAGNPPTWWNPQNRYGSTNEPVSAQTSVSSATQVKKTPVITEQPTEPLADISYEEETLSVPLEEQEPAAGGEENGLPVPSVLE